MSLRFWGFLFLVFSGAMWPARFTLGQAVGTNSVILAWDPSPSENISTYRIYYGAVSRTYTNVTEPANATFTTISNLIAGTTYYFAASAVDIVGLEHVLAQEISYSVGQPVPVALQLTASNSVPPLLTGFGPASSQQYLLVSSDLQTWLTLTNLALDTNGTFQFVDPGAASNQQRFYRLKQTFP